jgi:hypothetical protein
MADQVIVPEVLPPTGTLCHGRTQLITRDDLALIQTPPATRTFVPVPHHAVVAALLEALKFRHIAPVREQYAISPDGMKLFGVVDLETTETGYRFSVGIRNSNDKSFSLALTVGYRVFCCDNMMFNGDFEPVMRKHTKSLEIISVIELGVSQMQRNFSGMVQTVNAWQEKQLSDDKARLTIYRAFTEGELEAPRHLDRVVHGLYFQPQHPEFSPRTMWSLSNSFTSAFKELEPVPAFRATAKLADFLRTVN